MRDFWILVVVWFVLLSNVVADVPVWANVVVLTAVFAYFAWVVYMYIKFLRA